MKPRRFVVREGFSRACRFSVAFFTHRSVSICDRFPFQLTDEHIL